ncbi:MAG TPA: hypothetical protein VHN77_15170 [Phycisphaerales bacterium]|nr:hypothetical protein [Phycisphaerales bacterium]
MMNRTLRALVGGVIGASVGVGVGSAVLVPAQQATAQVRIALSAGRGGASMSPISKSAFRDYTKLLSLNDDQVQSGQELFDAYRAAFKVAQEEHQGKMDSIQETMRDTGDFQASVKDMQEATTAFSEKSSSLEASFMGDLRAILTDAQSEQWPAVERHRRRETGLRMGFYSGAAVDLLSMVEKLKADPGTPEFAALMSQYELELDRRIQDASRERADIAKDAEKNDPMDFEAQQERMKKMGESSKTIRDLNRDYVNRLGSLMGAEQRAALEAEYKKRSFPNVYDEAHIEQCLKAATGFADLDTTQKETLNTLYEQYRRDVQPLNEAWARAINDAEEDAGGSIAMEMNKWNAGGASEGVKKGRADRKELDAKFKQRLEEVLSPTQRERLPSKKSRDGDRGGLQIRIGGPGHGAEEEDE